MIVSASYKTDIPALYGAWFMARLAAGSCRVMNPYGRQVYDVRLDRENVSGFVFWTKNLRPFRDALVEIADRGDPFVVQYAINGYGRSLEPAVAPHGDAVAHMAWLAARFGARVPVWRYDPIVMTSHTPPEWHRENFARLAASLSGTTDEAVVSFAHIYRKTRRNLDRVARAGGFTWHDPPPSEKRELARTLAEIAADHGMALTVCAQPEYTPSGVPPASCIDAERLSDVAGAPLIAATKPNRPGCRCAECRDIGDYDTCTQGCAYCYAVSGRERARERLRAHGPEAPGLFVPTK